MTSSEEECDCECQNLLKYTYKRCTPENPYTSIRTAVQLMDNPITSDNYGRHVFIINDFLEACTYAFWLRDLPYVMKVMELLNARQELSCLFRQPLRRLLAVSSVPPMLMRVSEAAESFVDLIQYFSFFGYMLVSAKESDVQELVLEALLKLLQRNVPVGACCVRLSDCKRAVESSELPEIVAQLLEVADEELYTKLLKLTVLLVQISNQICHKMLHVNVIEHILLRLDPMWKTRTIKQPRNTLLKLLTIAHLYPTCKIVWTLLASLENVNSDFIVLLKPPGVESLKSLSCAIQIASTKNTRSCRSDRTNLMGIIVQLLHYFPDMPFSQARLTDDIAVLIARSGKTWASQMVQLEPCELDYRFQMMLLFAVRYLAKMESVAIRNIMKKRRTVAAVLKILKSGPSAVPWSPHHRIKLMSLSLYVLQYLVPSLSSDFDHCNGPILLLSMIDFYILEPYDVSILLACLRTIEVIMVTHEDIKSVCGVLQQNGAISVICKLCNDVLSKDVLTCNNQACLHHGFSALSKLCNHHKQTEESVYRLTKRFMDRVLNPSQEDPAFHPNMIISSLEMLWEGVVWNDHNLKVFVERGGVYDLLDLIQQSILSVKMIALSVLVDLCDEGSCIPHLITWRGNGFKLITMLLEIFRQDCRRLGVKLNSNGVITDIEIPIMGEQQWYETFGGQKHDHNSSPALTDLLLNSRPKVYAIVQLLNSRYKEQVAIANEHYCMYNDSLNPKDEVTMLLVETYLPLKMGETWVELMRDFAKARIIPIACDNDLVKSMTQRYYQWGLHIRRLQEEVLVMAKYKEKSKERLLYHIVREARLDQALTSLRELHYIAKATTSMLRLTYKNKQRQDLEESLRYTDDDEIYKHRTYMDELNITCLFNNAMSLNVQSNKIVEDEFLMKLCLDPVSSNTDENCENVEENEEYDSY